MLCPQPLRHHLLPFEAVRQRHDTRLRAGNPVLVADALNLLLCGLRPTVSCSQCGLLSVQHLVEKVQACFHFPSSVEQHSQILFDRGGVCRQRTRHQAGRDNADLGWAVHVKKRTRVFLPFVNALDVQRFVQQRFRLVPACQWARWSASAPKMEKCGHLPVLGRTFFPGQSGCCRGCSESWPTLAWGSLASLERAREPCSAALQHLPTCQM